MGNASRHPKLLIIGGSGFLSGTLARAAKAAGWDVWGVTRGQRAVPQGVVSLIADRHDEAGFAGVIADANQSWDLVVDCIGYAPSDVRQDLALMRSRAGQFVFVSSDFVFDPGHRKIPQSEEAEHYAASGYGGNKRLCELELIHGDAGNLAWSIVRPSHIYGPGSELGCLPLHGRDSNLIETLQQGKPVRLVGGGYFLQHPIFVRDLADLVLGLAGNTKARGQVFCAAGPDIIESRGYYALIARILGVELQIDEVPVARHLAEHPDAAPFCCHRVYDLGKLSAAGLAIPQTPIEQGMREHVGSLVKTVGPR